MKLENLFEVVSTASEGARPADQFRFRFDPARRRLVEGLMSVFGSSTAVRVQTQQAWEWTGPVTLTDTSTGRPRRLPFTLTLDGAIPKDERKAREALELLAPHYRGGTGQGRFDADKLIGELLRDVLFAWQTEIKGACAKALIPAEYGATRKLICEKLNQAGLPVSSVEFRPKTYDVPEDKRLEPYIDFTDSGEHLTVPDPEVLGDRKIGFKARLRFSQQVEGMVGLYAYQGTVFGRERGPALQEPGVEGQVQPLELWFRRLLQQEVARERWQDAARPVLSEAAKERLSSVIARGTGRELETLVIFPAANALAAQRASGRLSYEADYPIAGLRRNQLRIGHEVLYKVVNQDRWRSAGSPGVEELLRGYVQDAATAFLHGKEYGEIVRLYAGSIRDKRPLDKKMQAQVIGRAEAVGIKIEGPIASIVDLPGRAFVEGRQIALEEAEYPMRGSSSVMTSFTASAKLVLCDQPEGQRRFASRIQGSDAFEQQVKTRVQEIIATALKTSVQPADFYNSILVVRSGTEGTESVDVVATLRRQLEQELLNEFGLQVQRLEINRSPNDQVAARLYDIFNYNRIEGRLAATTGSEQLPTRYAFDYTLRVRNIVINGWNGFHARVARKSSDEHLREVETAAKDALERSVSEYDAPALLAAISDGAVAWRMAERIAAECGFAVEVVRLSARITPPEADARAHRNIALFEAEREKIEQLYLLHCEDEFESEKLLTKLQRIDERLAIARGQLATQASNEGGLTSQLTESVGLLPDGTFDRTAGRLTARAEATSGGPPS